MVIGRVSDASSSSVGKGQSKYGVRDEQGHLSDEKLIEIAEHKQLKMFEIKMSQGAKPGKGGILPGITPMLPQMA
jgi:glutamate synthase domain-containing protein 2